MEITFEANGMLLVDDARIKFRNFAGRETEYNREGDRNFVLVIKNPELADRLMRDGWNLRDKGTEEDPEFHLTVKVKFNNRGPNVYLKSGTATIQLNEDTAKRLDDIDILRVDMDIRPYDWVMKSGKSGRSAYLDSIHVTQKIDRFAARHEEAYAE